MDRCNLFRHRRVCTFRRSSSNKFLLPRLIRRSRSIRSHPSLFFPDLDTVKLDLTTTCAAMRGSRPITLLRLMLLMSRWAGGRDCFSPPFPYTLPRTVKIPFLRFSTRAHASSFVLECSYRFSFLSLSPDTRFNRALSNHSLFHGIRLGWREFKRAVRRAIV